MSNLRHLWLVALVVLVLAGLVIEASGDQISLSGNVSRLEYRQSRRAYQSRVVQAGLNRNSPMKKVDGDHLRYKPYWQKLSPSHGLFMVGFAKM